MPSLEGVTMTRKELGKLYDQYGDALYQFLLILTQDEGESKDLLQELLMRMAGLRKELRRLDDPRNYLFRMARNLTIDHHRKRRARESRDTKWHALQSPFAQAVEHDRKEFLSQLERAMASLPDEQRSVVFLKLCQECTFGEIATIEGISSDTAASRYRYALQKLQVTLAPLYEEIQ